MKVFVYLNLHKKMWYIKALEGPMKGRVIDRRLVVKLLNAYPKVSEKGRLRVLKENRKNVHAGMVGYLDPYSNLTHCHAPWGVKVWYNPYKSDHFMVGKHDWFVGASLVHMNINSYDGKVVAYDPILFRPQDRSIE
jgi:hypothetical protein